MATQAYVARAGEELGRVAEACEGGAVFNLVFRRAMVVWTRQLAIDRAAGGNVVTSAWTKVGL